MLACLGLAADRAENPAARASAVEAHNALKEKDYDRAIAYFRNAVALDPAQPAYRKDLAYTLLKTGDTEEARDQFEHIVRLSTQDWHSTLEYGYLCHETRRVREARRIFDLVRHNADPASRAAAEPAFQNVDRPLAAAMQRWTEALQHNPDDFSAHQELAHAAEDRGDPKLAAAHYRSAFQLQPGRAYLLTDLARALDQAGDQEGAAAAWLAGSRSANQRAVDAAQAHLPKRFPYASEFLQALEVDPSNTNMRRDLAFLWIAVQKPQEAETQFLKVLEIEPGDLVSLAQLGLLRLARGDRAGAQPLLDKVLTGKDEVLAARVRAALASAPAVPPTPATLPPPPPSAPAQTAPQKTASPQPQASAREMADKSYAAGYLSDAARYYNSALEENPKDQEARLKLAYTYNLLRQDEEAIRHFEIAMRDATDNRIRREARRAYGNLRAGAAHVRTTLWLLPMFSSRWHSGLAYGQVKTELRLRSLPVRPYVSVRFVGDSQRGAGSVMPASLSENSFIGAVGVTASYKFLTAWAEAGNALRFRDTPSTGRLTPDYRTGLSFGRAFGPGRAISEAGWFVETNADAVALSRFHWDALVYTQTRAGYTLPVAGPLEWQLCWNANVVADRKREAWANFFDLGPGIRFHIKPLPAAMVWSLDFLRGSYLADGSAKPTYHDIRAGLWYAFTH